MTSGRLFVAGTVALLASVAAPPASGHDPLEATAAARIDADGLELSITLGARRGFRACGHTPFEACARELYVVVSAGAVLKPRSARGAVREDGDLVLVVNYPRPRAGPLRLTAAHLQRNRDEMAGATLSVLAGDKLLHRQVLDADNASVVVQLAVK
jgi:hypothetical protein